MNTSDVTDQQIAECVQTSRDTMALSNDGSQAILKFVTTNGVPPSLQGLGLSAYTHDEIIAIKIASGMQ